MKVSNKGISYIELILVIGISAMLVGLASLSIGIISRNNAEKAATKLEAAFSHAQALSMAKGQTNGSLTITSDGSSYYYYYGTDDSAKSKFASSPCKVELIADDGTVTPINASGAKFYFKPTTGSIDSTVAGSCGSYKVKIANGGKTEVFLKVYKTTGKCELVAN